ncbi:MAG: CPBP family intramembrane glutamic endopeptidase [Patescibacteria group bacterium]
MDETKLRTLNKTYFIWSGVLIIWSLYRVYIRLPEWVDDFVIKPVVFVLPVLFYVIYRERRPLASIGLTLGKFFRDVYLGLGFGMLFALEGLVANSVKHGTFSFAPLIPITGGQLILAVVLALVAAGSEEVLVRGFFYTRLRDGYGSEMKALVISTAMYVLLLVPAIFLISRLVGMTLFVFVLTNIVMSLANTLIFSETKTLTVPILIHAFWNMAVALYL